ncbi:indole-3-glycerol phosphate synthase TrpC [Dissulfurirhabdus thermomarina]|uniref:Indole-3-glycerol phosphate synthase n=1 Tax=Dissulfurirhabdus thermomarina TaxID=1765737 RepID=A0A6N9TN04_DISTH|nr:indole-3-glycerol phosphate synthase TrpC [Dissulfurirhabdus thermomarina]NDY42519.1 indole-3-glycerol phosphate synthase TrpC [Dissulfurirhabdus thermomarina]NMX24206.1 indole-3-glycerol phosphate synthase TrpC [Dissulfurirhabdus thermomarina]
MNILETIVAHKREEVAARRRAGLRPPEREIAPHRPFRAALLDEPGVSVIAELKKASPSKGVLAADFRPLDLARRYRAGGAAAISVLTDERFFQGRIETLAAVREVVDLPLLRKDFLIDHFQVDEAFAWGADAVLLIAAILDRVLLGELLAHAREAGLDCLVEVHDERELEEVLAAGADLVGVNNRNLRDFTVSIETTLRLRERVPGEVPLVSESGISTPEDVARLRAAGVTAVLVGEGLVTAPDPAEAVRALRGAGAGR